MLGNVPSIVAIVARGKRIPAPLSFSQSSSRPPSLFLRPPSLTCRLPLFVVAFLAVIRMSLPPAPTKVASCLPCQWEAFDGKKRLLRVSGKLSSSPSPSPSPLLLKLLASSISAGMFPPSKFSSFVFSMALATPPPCCHSLALPLSFSLFPPLRRQLLSPSPSLFPPFAPY